MPLTCGDNFPRGPDSVISPAIPLSNSGWNPEVPGDWIAPNHADVAGKAQGVAQFRPGLIHTGSQPRVRTLRGNRIG